MTNEEIMQYYDDLIRLAVSKCGSQTEAEDLVGDTVLAAALYLQKGGIIKYPKTWLANTLLHKFNDSLRKKYRSPIITCLDDHLDMPAEEEGERLSSEEAARIRKELNHLAFITREVMIRYYFGGQSVSDIADGLGIPEGTVKSRLFAGRSQMKKGLETMETRENYLPGKMYLSFGGSAGSKMEPMSLVEDDLIAQNLLILAYEKPVTVSELSKAIGIPAAYIEPIIQKLVDSELMVQTDGGKVYTDFLINRPQDMLKNFQPQREFAHRHFETIWAIIRQMSERIADMPFVCAMGEEEKTKLDRYAVLKALQDFCGAFGTSKVEATCFPKRKDGGRWFAHAIAFDAGYNRREYNESMEYTILGGHRSSEVFVDNRSRKVYLFEFDTTLWDCPHRFGNAPELYFKHIIPLLWNIYSGIPLDKNTEIPNEFISLIPKFTEFGLFKSEKGRLSLAIPVLKESEYGEVCSAIRDATEKLKTALGDELTAFVSAMKTPVPKHLTSVPELFRYIDATAYLEMSVVREAYEKGLHLKKVDYCCPPVVLVC